MNSKFLVAAFIFAAVIQAAPVLARGAEPRLSEDITLGPLQVVLERSVYFPGPGGQMTDVSAGIYDVSRADTNTLLLKGEGGAFQILASGFEYGEPIESEFALSFNEDEDIHHIVLLDTEDKSLVAIGSYTGITTRAVARLNTSRYRTRVKTVMNQPRIYAGTLQAQRKRVTPSMNAIRPTAENLRVQQQAARLPGRTTLDPSKESARPVIQFTVSSPSDGATWRTNFDYTIRWSVTQVSGLRRDMTQGQEVQIELLRGTGQKVLDIFTGIASGEYKWKVPGNLTPGTYRTRITMPGRSRSSGVFRIDSKVPIVLRLKSHNDVNEVWSLHAESDEVVRDLLFSDFVPYLAPVIEDTRDVSGGYDTRSVISLEQDFLYSIAFVQEKHDFYTDEKGWFAVLLPMECSTEPFRPGRQYHPGYTILRETITIFDAPTSFYFERRGRKEQILRGPDGRVYLFVAFTPKDPNSQKGWLGQAQEHPILLQSAIAAGYTLYSLDEFTNKKEPFSATE